MFFLSRNFKFFGFKAKYSIFTVFDADSASRRPFLCSFVGLCGPKPSPLTGYLDPKYEYFHKEDFLLSGPINKNLPSNSGLKPLLSFSPSSLLSSHAGQSGRRDLAPLRVARRTDGRTDGGSISPGGAVGIGFSVAGSLPAAPVLRGLFSWLNVCPPTFPGSSSYSSRVFPCRDFPPANSAALGSFQLKPPPAPALFCF